MPDTPTNPQKNFILSKIIIPLLLKKPYRCAIMREILIYDIKIEARKTKVPEIKKMFTAYFVGKGISPKSSEV